MKKYVILVDACSDLPKELRDEYDIEFIASHLNTPEKKNIPSTLTWDFMEREEFYKELKKNPAGFSTSPNSPDEYKEKFQEFVGAGYDVLTVTISTGLSGTFNFASQAAKEVMEENKDAKLVVVDSMRFTTGIGLLAILASEKRAAGATIEECAAYLEENKNNCHEMGVLDDLSFVAKKGRMSNFKAFMGTLVGVKPLGEFDYKGLTTVVGKAKGEKNAIEAIVKYIEKTIVNPQDQLVFVANTSRVKQAEELKKRIEEVIKPKKVIINETMPSCSINMGPGLYAAYYMGTKISQDMSEETKIMTDILAAK